MVHNNKVLTVSYGTFSCTLEGFEDSFGTMKAIAEYFRDLASDDRYFGAEPPQPDAEMLARIAQREVARQVEARTSSEGIHLRAATPAATAPVQTPAAPPPAAVDATIQPAPVSAKVIAQEADPLAGQQDQTSAEAEVVAAEPAFDERDIDPGEVELFEEAGVTSTSAAATDENAAKTDTPDTETADEAVTADEAETADLMVQDVAIDSGHEASVDMATIAAISAAVAQTDEAPQGSEVDFFDAETGAETEAKSAAPADLAVNHGEDTVPAVDSIAAKLQRIRAVVAQTPEDEFSEDEHAEAFVEAAAAELSQEEDEADEILGAADADDDEISRALDRLDLNGDLVEQTSAADPGMADTTTDDASADPVQATTAQEEAQEVSDSDLLFSDLDAVKNAAQPDEDATAVVTPKRRIVRIARLEKPVAAEEPDTVDAVQAAITDTVQAEASEVLAAPTGNPEAEADTVPMPAPEPEPEPETISAAQPRARIVKMKREELAKIVAAGGLEEVVEDADDESSAALSPADIRTESTLDEDDEADLMRELAQVEADLLASTRTETVAPKAAEEQPVEDSTPAQQEQPPAEVIAEQRPASQSPDSDVSRLMAAAQSKLDDPDNATSRETYSQLRAAVAAAEADRSAGGTVVSADDAEPYREDLANVVRPRRPATSAAKPVRPRAAASRPAPLKLVAEQRIDAVAAAPAEPVRPRRISVLEEDAAPQQDVSDTFAEYARDRGAAELHELLEAAAAYMSFVEGRDHFSRPQLMNKVRNIGNGDFNREDGLRSFGQLLRDGKIARAENGRFAATEETGYRPATRAAG